MEEKCGARYRDGHQLTHNMQFVVKARINRKYASLRDSGCNGSDRFSVDVYYLARSASARSATTRSTDVYTECLTINDTAVVYR